jgi:hypothetical protein
VRPWGIRFLRAVCEYLFLTLGDYGIRIAGHKRQKEPPLPGLSVAFGASRIANLPASRIGREKRAMKNAFGIACRMGAGVRA